MFAVGTLVKYRPGHDIESVNLNPCFVEQVPRGLTHYWGHWCQYMEAQGQGGGWRLPVELTSKKAISCLSTDWKTLPCTDVWMQLMVTLYTRSHTNSSTALQANIQTKVKHDLKTTNQHYKQAWNFVILGARTFGHPVHIFFKGTKA